MLAHSETFLYLLERNNAITTTDAIVTTHNDKKRMTGYIPYITGMKHVICDIRVYHVT